MPAIKPSTERQGLNIAAGEINASIARSGLSRQQVMLTCGCGQTAYYERLEDPRLYTLLQLQRLAKKTKMDPLQAASIMLGRKVTLNDVMNS